jgi:hypothetical protein
MHTTKLIVTICLVLIAQFSIGQVYQLMPQYGYQAPRMAFDSTIQIPTFCGVPTLKSVQFVNKKGAIAFDSCNNRFYTYNPKTLSWSQVSGGGGSTDTTSLSNRINLKIDSIKKRRDSVFSYRNGSEVFQFKDSVGGGSVPTLNQVLASGSVGTDKDITLNDADLGHQISIVVNQTYPTIQINSNNATTNSLVFQSNNANNFSGITSVIDDGVNPSTTQQLVLGTSDGSVFMPFNDRSSDTLATLFNLRNSGTTIDTTSLSNRINGKIDSLKRRTDSVFAYRNGNQIFQYKDSVGTNPPPNGYYGAFQDNTTQTALDVDVATSVKFNTTDLSNGVTIVNDGSGNPTRVTIANAGVYNIQFSLQLEKISGSGNYVIDIWLRKNGTNVEGTTGKIVLTGSANASPVVAAWNYVLQLASNDYVQIMWSTSNTNAVINSESASTPYPSVPSSILTITQQSGIMAGTGISPIDTANMLLPYLRKADTTVFQRKQFAANSIQGNNTSASANAQSIFFKDTSGTYTGTITWGGTAPTSLTATYRWVRIGRKVDLNITLVYANAGTTNSTLLLTMPSDAPTPAEPTGLTSNSNYLYPVLGKVNINATTLTNAAERGAIRKNSAGNGYEIFLNFTSSGYSMAYITTTYWTN